MLRLGETRDEVRVVADQRGCPTYARDIAIGLARIAQNLLDRAEDMELRGIFHLAGTGETNWAEFASAIFQSPELVGKRTPRITPITTAEYPTPARRPLNSRLDCCKLARIHGLRLPHWRESLKECLRLLKKE
jgi:dTDP-4-dehydrorhamnose reductase